MTFKGKRDKNGFNMCREQPTLFSTVMELLETESSEMTHDA